MLSTELAAGRAGSAASSTPARRITMCSVASPHHDRSSSALLRLPCNESSRSVAGAAFISASSSNETLLDPAAMDPHFERAFGDAVGTLRAWSAGSFSGLAQQAEVSLLGEDDAKTI
jgi:hypothetical protein